MRRVPRYRPWLASFGAGVGFSTLLGACLPAAPGGAAPDAATGALRITLHDALGQEHAAESAPERPRIVLAVALPFAEDESGPWLFRGELDDALLDDLERAPLNAASMARIVPSTVRRDADAAQLTPRAPLDEGGRYVVALPAFARVATGSRVGVVAARSFRVLATGGGANLVETFPAAGSVGVPTNLGSVALRFDDAVDGIEHVRCLVDGLEQGVTVVRSDCASLGFGETDCARMLVDGPWPPGARVVLDASAVTDRYGDPIVEAPSFVLGSSSDVSPPSFGALPCAVDELATGFGCLLVRDTSLVVRARVDEPARIEATFDAHRAFGLSVLGDVTVSLDSLEADRAGVFAMTATGLTDAITRAEIATQTTEPLARVVVDEVRADPRGPEPTQEYVEIWNRGEVPVELAGFHLSDAPDRLGDALPAATLPGGARALIVADDFDARSPLDLGPPEGVPLLRIGASIGTSGLSNGGEPVYLRDAHGRRLSEVPAMATSASGACIVRRRADTFAELPCTPGLETP